MHAKHLVSLLAFSTALGGFAACGGSAPPTAPGPTAAFTFSGTVKSANVGVADVQVALTGDASKNTVTNSQGAFSFADVPGSRFFITPSSEAYVFTPSRYELGAASRFDLDFAAAKTGKGGVLLSVGDTAPDFTAVDQNGQTVSLYAYRGQVVFIDVSADWCGSCRVQAPKLEALYEQYVGQGFQAFTVLVSGSAAAWASTFNVSHPVLEDKSRAISAPYATGWLPTNVILDRSLTIRYLEADDFDEPRILAVLKQYL